jgi:hypothetical protein
MHKLGLIVPYRNRPTQLKNFQRFITTYLVDGGYEYELIVVEQSDSKPFNRGKLLNIGFLKAKELGCDYVCFHDLDMLPIDVDYSYSDKPIQLANNFVYETGVSRTITDEYFGGVTIFPIEDFENINGYSNEYWGWGFEDNDLLERCREIGVPLGHKYYRQNGITGIGVQFDGKKSFIRLPNRCNFRKPISFYTTFSVDRFLMLDESQVTEEYCIFSIPGNDLNLSYNTFNTYKFETYDDYSNALSIHSKNLPPLTSKSIITINPNNKVIYFYLNGKLVGKKKYENTLLSYKDEKYLYLGVGDPNRTEKNKWFSGYINEFAIFNKELNKGEIKSLMNNSHHSLLQKFDDYNAGDSLISYYDSRFTVENTLKDLTQTEDGFMFNCKLIKTYQPKEYLNLIPERRRATFKMIKHKENGYKDGYWINWASRKNQIRYYRKLNNGMNLFKDGLSNLKYKNIDFDSNQNYHHIRTWL